MEKLMQMVENYAATCTNCELCLGRIKPVFDKGNPKADIFICGMVPGPEENKVGAPFIGRAGQMLDEILKDVNLTLDDVYVTNAVKCALKPGIPLKNDWIGACSIYLISQVSLVMPKVVITLGADATNAMLGSGLDTKISKMRGSVHYYFNVPLVPTYHPSYLIRGGSKQHKHYTRVLEDFDLAKTVRDIERTD